MTTDDQRSFVTFLYADIQWQTNAVATINNTLFLPGSRRQAIRNLVTTSNFGVPGMWMYRVDTTIISPGPP